MSSSGSRANENGDVLATTVEDALQRHGYQKIESALLFRNRKYLSAQGKYYAREVYVGASPFEGKRRRVDFFIVSDVFPEGLIIECKWQEGGGSKEEAFAYLVLCIKKTAIPTIVILDGEGYTLGAERHLRKEVDKRIFLAVWGVTEFLKARNAGYFSTGVMPSHQNTNQAENGRLWNEEELDA